MQRGCVDFGSTFTKLLVVDIDTGRVLASSSAATTITTDVIDGLDDAKVGVQRGCFARRRPSHVRMQLSGRWTAPRSCWL